MARKKRRKRKIPSKGSLDKVKRLLRDKDFRELVIQIFIAILKNLKR